MKTYKLITFIEVDETNSNVPTLEEFIEAVGDSLSTPDNHHYGIKKIETTGEEVENF